jgi:5-(carboxyamino)imidazole ribonucleotide synthase
MARFPLAPGSTIGVLGGGQLGRMMAMAAARLGLKTVVLDPDRGGPAAQVCAGEIVAAYTDHDALRKLARASDVITFEFENVPAEVVSALQEAGAEVAPGPRALAVAQDRVEEKTFLEGLGVETVDFATIGSAEELDHALRRMPTPALLKTRREGYDGKGQVWVESHEGAEAAWAKIGGKPAILEARADFRREVSVIAARGRDGEVASYPLSENHHEGGILRRTTAPAAATQELADHAEGIAHRILDGLDYVGVLAVEMFELVDGRLLVNEIAPRVHNSGHWTLDGCQVDQFEQHVRAISGWPLGPTEAIGRTEMINLIGDEADQWPKLAAEGHARIWLYGKAEARPGRKMGHVNRLMGL